VTTSPTPGAPVASTLKDGRTVEPVREILWGTSAGVRKY